MNSILTRALMKYHNKFFTMSPSEQEAWKLQEHDEIDKKVRAYVDDALGMSEEDEHNHEKLFEYNATMLEYVGIGENQFMLNDFNWNTETVAYGNLYDYNVYYHNWQEEAFATDGLVDDYEKKELYNRWASWARALVDDKFKYLNLDSFQIWITWELETVSFDWIEERLPHNYEAGPDNGKKVEGGSLWDMHVNAKGLEGWYEQMTDFSREWIINKYDKMEELGDVVFKVDNTKELYDPSISYIFGSLNVLKNLTFVNFVNDAEAVKGENELLFTYRDKIIMEFKAALAEKFAEVKKTDPTVMKKKKRREIVMSDDALDDLDGM